MRFTLLLIISFMSFELQAQSCSSINHIFLIHGIGGSAKSFGSMQEYLNKTQNCSKTESFEYDTGNSLLSTYDFAASFQEFIKFKIQNNEIAPEDKISLIMHSQGGIVGNLWLNLIHQTDPSIFQQVDAFITLSTPHWGADIANLGEHIFYTLPTGVNNPLSPFGRIELNEMSFGSSTIRNMSWSFNNVYETPGIRPLALGGYHQIKDPLFGESDVVVPLYSSRPDLYFTDIDTDKNIPDARIGINYFKKTSNVTFVAVKATHLKLDTPGIVDIPANCLAATGCDHPSLPYITQHLNGVSIIPSEPELKEFRVSIYLNSTGLQDESEASLQLVSAGDTTIPLTEKFNAYRGVASVQDTIAFSFRGKVKKSGTQSVQLKLQLKNGITRSVEVPVEGGHSSVATLNFN